MTCIAGIVDKENECVYIGGDSSATCGNDVINVSNPKVFKVGSFVFGCSGSFRVMQIIQHNFKPTKVGKDIHRSMCINFVEELSEVLILNGITRNESNNFDDLLMLVGYKDRLFSIDPSLSVLEATCGYEAIGAGEEYAKGALFASKSGDKFISVNMALAAAKHHCAKVDGRFTTLKTGK